MMSNGAAGAGVVARDSSGKIIFTAWRSLRRCSDAAEAEALACVEGIRLAVEWASGRSKRFSRGETNRSSASFWQKQRSSCDSL
nr:unnamed protein product [Digitaria exilis]